MPTPRKDKLASVRMREPSLRRRNDDDGIYEAGHYVAVHDSPDAGSGDEGCGDVVSGFEAEGFSSGLASDTVPTENREEDNDECEGLSVDDNGYERDQDEGDGESEVDDAHHYLVRWCLRGNRRLTLPTEPIAVPIESTMAAMRSEIRAPWMMRVSMSRPRGSVPRMMF